MPIWSKGNWICKNPCLNNSRSRGDAKCQKVLVLIPDLVLLINPDYLRAVVANLWHTCQRGHSEPSQPACDHSAATHPQPELHMPGVMGMYSGHWPPQFGSASKRSRCSSLKPSQTEGASAHHSCPEFQPFTLGTSAVVGNQCQKGSLPLF